MTDKPTASPLAAALAAFQLALPPIPKGATGQVPGKRTHKYADLADLSAAVLPLLAKQGLSWTTKPTLDDQGRFVLEYKLLHTSGEAETGAYPLPQGTAWEIGSAITYGRRYCLSAVTGVAADDDDDGHAAQHAARPPAQAAATEPEMSELDAALAAVRATCKANKYDARVVANRYKAERGVDLRAETDAAKIHAFRDSLAGVPQAELAATNGVPA